jgi:hypothetical protein
MPHNDGRNTPGDVSRRHLFKQVGIAGAAAALSGAAPTIATTETAAEPTRTATAPMPAPHAAPRLEALETLTAAEADTLESMVARLIPTDESGPGASEARAAHYIDRAPVRAYPIEGRFEGQFHDDRRRSKRRRTAQARVSALRAIPL